jgi:hypothetical protein
MDAIKLWCDSHRTCVHIIRTVAIAALGVSTVAAQQTLEVRESEQFQQRLAGVSYEADTYPDHSSPPWFRFDPVAGATDVVSDGILILDMVNRNNLADRAPRIYYRTSTGAEGNFWDGDPETGYTVEIRIRVDEDYDPTHGAMFLSTRGGSAGGQGKIQFRHDSIRWVNLTDDRPFTRVLAEGMDNSQDFHVFRMVKMPGLNRWHVWRDGVLVGTHLQGGSIGANELIFGDTTAARYAGKVSIDYIRWDTSGAYAPTAESATIPETPNEIRIYGAKEVIFPTRVDGLYQVQTSLDGEQWTNLGGHFLGTGESMSRTLSDRDDAVLVRVLESEQP